MIPAEAIEAAAEWLPHSDDCEVRPERYCTCWQPRINSMRAALEAAAPHIRAQAIEDAALDIRQWSHVFETLRARAADERTRK